MATGHYPLPGDSLRVRCLAEAIYELDPAWADPAVCRAEMERLAREATAVVDQLDVIVSQMERVCLASQPAAVITTGGDEAAAFELHQAAYGGSFLEDVLARVGAYT